MGLVRHYWVIVKLMLTVLATTVLLLHAQVVSRLAAAAQSGLADAAPLRSEILHAGLGAIVLLAAAVLGIYKPQGLTRYGWRQLYGQNSQAPPAP